MTSPITPEIQAKIALWRMRIAEGTITQDEMKEAVLFLRAGRVASASAVAKRKKALVELPTAGDMLSELEGL